MSHHVLMITTEYPPKVLGGLATHVSELAAGLCRQGDQVTVVVPVEDVAEVSRDANLSVHSVPMNGALSPTPTTPLLRTVLLSSNLQAIGHSLP